LQALSNGFAVLAGGGGSTRGLEPTAKERDDFRAQRLRSYMTAVTGRVF
jgi:hypothetical protein